MSYLKVKSGYRSGSTDLVAEFFGPCFRECSAYSRAVGFFTSTALKAWAEGLTRMQHSPLSIRLLIGPTLSREDKDVLSDAMANNGEVPFQRIADEFLEKALAYVDGEEAHRLWLFRSLLESGKLELKVAFTESGEGIYHEKIGIFSFPNGDWIAFDGSLNESQYAHTLNYERIHVFRSWKTDDKERGQIVIDDFESAWNGTARGLKVLAPSQHVLNKILNASPNSGSHRTSSDDDRWRHQGEAVEAFLKTGRGILEMATGTGKTKTSLKIIDRLIKADAIDSIVITLTGTDLLNQWYDELLQWQSSAGLVWPVLRHFDRFHELGSFEVLDGRKVLLVSRTALHRLRKISDSRLLSRTIIVHDEVHGLGSQDNRNKLHGFHHGFGFVLGLSATPEREYDQEGSDFIRSEIGEVVFEFRLEDAIKRGILTEMEYVPLPYFLSDEEKRRIAKYFSLRNSDASLAYSDEDIWRMIASVYKAASSKIDVFRDFLERRPEILNRCILFVHDTPYGERVMQTIHHVSHNYKGYFSGEHTKYLKDFADNRISALITCHRLSQGIDIQDVGCVILFSSDRAKLETIQRIGRCLRVDPENREKRALVIDFVLEPNQGDSQGRAADDERKAWLTSLAGIRRRARPH